MPEYRIVGAATYEVVTVIEAASEQDAVSAFERGEGENESSAIVHREVVACVAVEP